MRWYREAEEARRRQSKIDFRETFRNEEAHIY
jgi:hypothetical protein